IETPRADVVVVVDTSAFGDDAEHQARIAVAEALLRSLSAEDHFAVVAADLGAEVLYPQQGLEAATPEAIDAALAALSDHRHGGATDLGAIFERALNRVQGTEQPAVVYIGDGLATSGERGADALAERLRR
ncbi:MAG: VWA domain-containing protein, partial [Myxococcales bacterium]|nr:VWA domain-containing protein [Myxococcales bacterium]